MAELRIDRVGVRDIDLLVAGKIAANPEFARPFLGSRETGPLSLLSMKLWQQELIMEEQRNCFRRSRTKDGLTLMLLLQHLI